MWMPPGYCREYHYGGPWKHGGSRHGSPTVPPGISSPSNRAFGAGHIARACFTGTAELEVYAQVVQVIGKGEAACLAMAEVQGWCVASDERRKFPRLANERLGPGRVVNTAGTFVLAIRASLLSVEEAVGHPSAVGSDSHLSRRRSRWSIRRGPRLGSSEISQLLDERREPQASPGRLHG